MVKNQNILLEICSSSNKYQMRWEGKCDGGQKKKKKDCDCEEAENLV